MTSESDDVGAVVTTASSDIYLPNQVPGSARERDDAAAYIRGLEAACATMRAKLTEAERERDEAIARRCEAEVVYDQACEERDAATARAAEAERLLGDIVDTLQHLREVTFVNPGVQKRWRNLIAAARSHLLSALTTAPMVGAMSAKQDLHIRSLALATITRGNQLAEYANLEGVVAQKRRKKLRTQQAEHAVLFAAELLRRLDTHADYTRRVGALFNALDRCVMSDELRAKRAELVAEHPIEGGADVW